MTLAPSSNDFASAIPRAPGSNSTWGTQYSRHIRQVIKHAAEHAPRSVQRHLGPSEIGAPCSRQIVGKIIANTYPGHPGGARTNHVPDMWPAIIGTAVHAWMAGTLDRENITLGMQRYLTELRVAPTPDHPGSTDFYDTIEQAVCDWKGLHVHTPIATPDGWTTIGLLSPGDVVFGADGQPCTIIRTYPVQYRDCYRITFDDNSELITDDVQELPFGIAGKRPRATTMSVSAAVSQIWSKRTRAQRQLYVLNGGALELPPSDLAVHPYVLGCWLGDGSVHSGTIGADAKDADELFGHIQSCGYAISRPHGQRKFVRTVYGLSTQLRELDLQWRDLNWPDSHGRLAGIKRIPPHYLRASREQRLALLQGLMDTDGTWNQPRKRAVFNTTDKGLAESAAELITTLGWKAHIAPHLSRGFGLTVTEYYVEFTPEDANPFRLNRKANLAQLTGTTKSRRRLIQSIEPILSVPTRCIDVDSQDHLYLAGDQLLPVHNCLGPSSLAKIRSGNPPRKYVVQLLLYGLGCQLAGLPVKRVAIIACPRTEATLDSMYVWDHPVWSEEDAELLAEVLRVNEIRKQIAEQVLRGVIKIEEVPIVPDDSECFFCVTGSTQTVTRNGIKPIAELAGSTHELLVPTLGSKGALRAQGSFKPAAVREFGQQKLWEIRLRRQRTEKAIQATAEHRWILASGKGWNLQRPDAYERTTQELRPGDKLRALKARTPVRAEIMPVAIAQGFTFGDGTTGQGNRPATLALYDNSNGKAEALLPFFPGRAPVRYGRGTPDYQAMQLVYGLPRFWKNLPPLEESRTFLLSWLAGYFAADGCAGEDGSVALSSAVEDNILFARDIAAVCGIGYGSVRSSWHTGYGSKLVQQWSIGLRRRDLPDWFFILEEHKRRVALANAKQQGERTFNWTVESVTETSTVETVYCAVVPGVGAFGLADDLMTGNCAQYRPQSAKDGGPGCSGTIGNRNLIVA